MSGVTSLEKETGKYQVETIKNISNDCELDKQCVAECFHTIASNNGKFNGACLHLEALLNHALLSTLFRHHMQEVILSFFESTFGKSSTGSPQIMFFKVLKKWGTINLGVDTTVLESLNNENLFTSAREKLQGLRSSFTTTTKVKLLHCGQLSQNKLKYKN